jgi:hypothetical protein
MPGREEQLKTKKLIDAKTKLRQMLSLIDEPQGARVRAAVGVIWKALIGPGRFPRPAYFETTPIVPSHVSTN